MHPMLLAASEAATGSAPAWTVTLMQWAFLIPLIMTGTFLFHLLLSKKLMKVAGEKAVSAVGILAITVCFFMSLGIGYGWIARTNAPPVHETPEYVAAEAACFGPSNAERSGAHHASEGVNAEGAGHGEETTAGKGTDGHGADKPKSSSTSDHGGTPEPGGTSEHGAESGSMELAGGTVLLSGDEPAVGAATGGAKEEHHSVVPVCTSITWFEIGTHTYEAGTIVDGLSVMMLITVTLISMLVHWYSTAYLKDDVRFVHYYAFLSLFSAAMLFYVLSNNTLQMLVGWELVGVCSFALIGHWWEEKKNTDAALKAFLTNRVGDVGLILGVIVLFFGAGGSSFNVFHINEYAGSSGANTSLLFVGSLLLFFGVTSKSGQFPLHTWLPDAMAGPTPVSALIHAATMVVAGVYLVARMYPTFFVGMDIGNGGNWAPVGNYVAIIGAITALVGASLAFVQHDLKKVLAYSTVSQLGFMVMALGVGAWTAGVFHLFTHAMFKACLFLGAGSVSHACHHTFDMREMGGLEKHMPITKRTFMLCSWALAGVPIMSGFWSKDEILAGAQQGQNGKPYYAILAIGLVVGGMTASYMTRAYHLTFKGEYRGHAHPHESPKVMTVPLVILTFLAFIAVFFNIPKFFTDIFTGTFGPSVTEKVAVRFEHFVEPTWVFVEGIDHPKFNLIVAGVSLLFAAAGWQIMKRYLTTGIATGATAKPGVARFGYRLLENKYYLDKIYEQGVRDSVRGPMARASYWFNMRVIDGIVNAFGIGARKFGDLTYKYVDQKGIDGAINGTGAVSSEGGQFLRTLFGTGKVQQYGAWLFGGAVVFAGMIVVFVK